MANTCWKDRERQVFWMSFDRRAMKGEARERMRNARPYPILVSLVALIVLAFINTLSLRISGGLSVEVLANGEVILPKVTMLDSLFIIAMDVISQLLYFGHQLYCLRTIRKEASGFGNLLDGFAVAGKVILLWLLTGILVFLWSLLLVIPGIIAMYRYRMAPYLLITNPQWSVTDCLRQSRLMMRGRKWEMFVLDLSFIGWYILNLLPLSLVMFLPEALGWLATCLSLLVSVYLFPFRSLTEAAFFNCLDGWQQSGERGLPDAHSEEKPPWEY